MFTLDERVSPLFSQLARQHAREQLCRCEAGVLLRGRLRDRPGQIPRQWAKFEANELAHFGTVAPP